LSAGVGSETELLDALANALRFPDYFGGNWDALNECINDLSWLPPGDVVLRHVDLPLVDDRASLSIYLSILRDAVESWDATGSNLIFASPEKRDATGERALLARREFFVIFPSDTQRVVEAIMYEGESRG
jgi:RNAse (barnase) inhibitor barstar